MVLAPERHGPDGALDGVVVELDAAIVEEAGECRPARERAQQAARTMSPFAASVSNPA